MTLVSLEPAALRSRVKHSTTEPLRLHGSFAVDSSFIIAPYAGSVFGPCFIMQCILSSFAIIMLEERERAGCFFFCFCFLNWLLDVLSMLLFCGSSSRCRRSVCSV